jgi:hypothetical protein
MKVTTAQREDGTRRHTFWFDPRFAIGLALVVASVGGVLWVVSAADASVQVLAARSALSPGDRIGAGDLVSQSVRLGQSSAKYLTTADLPGAGLVVTRAVSAGELVPASAVGNAAGLRVASVVVTVRGELPKSIAAGTVVDLWSGVEGENGEFGAPSVLVSSATVVRLIEADGIIADGSSGSVELLIPRPKTARVLESIANADAISLVPVSIPVKG